ncbi:MAG: energy-coupling factor transporter ATPase [Thermaerobacterales bacterium]
MPVSSGPLLEVENLRVRYPMGEGDALRGVSFDLKQGESLLVVGASGSGKSTLGLALAGLIPRAVDAELSGSVRVMGRDTAAMAPGDAARHAGMVFQDPETQFCMLTVEDEVAFGLENAGLARDEMEPRIAAVLDSVGLGSERGTRIDRLSGGMKQKLALACVMALRPPVLILDEPTANLDPEASQTFFTVLKDLLRTRDYGVILIEHKLELPAALADRVMVMVNGQIAALGPPREVFGGMADDLRAMGVWQPFASEVAQRVAGAGMPLFPYPLTIAELCDRSLEQPATAAAVEEAVLALRRGPGASPASSSPAGERGSEPLAAPPDPALSLRQVSFHYQTAEGPRQVLRDLTWDIPQGCFAALVGANGSGKSTLAHLALALLRPQAGTIHFAGEPLGGISRRRLAQLAGLVFQNPEHQFITDTVFEELAASRAVAGGSAGSRRRNESEASGGDDAATAVYSLLDEFDLAHLAAAHPFALSQGEKRRLSVATMLAAGQMLLVLDEPTFGQDHDNAYRLMERLAARNRRGCTIIMITHDMRLVWEYADRAAVLTGGRIAFWGPPDELFRQRPEIMARARLEPPLPVRLLAGLRQGAVRAGQEGGDEDVQLL